MMRRYTNLLETLLSRRGYEVVLASNGLRGLELFRRKFPDVVVLDLKMLEMNGLAVFAMGTPTQSDPAGGDPDGSRDRRGRAASAGVRGDRVCRKRFSLHRLGDALKRLLHTPNA